MRKWIVSAATIVLLGLALAGGPRAGEAAGKYPALDKLAHKDQEIYLVFKQQSLRKVLGTLYNLGVVEKVSFAEGFKDTRIDVQIEKKTLKDALTQIAEENGLDYEAPDPTTLLVKKAGDKP